MVNYENVLAFEVGTHQQQYQLHCVVGDDHYSGFLQINESHFSGIGQTEMLWIKG